MKIVIGKKVEKRKIFVAGSPPDIDQDYESEGRDQIKEYFINHYGKNQVAYIGTYGEMKMASSLQDFGKLSGMTPQEAIFMTSMLPKNPTDELKTLTSLFRYSNETPKLKKLIKENVDFINDVSIALGSLRSAGVHAAGVVVTPEFDEEGNRKEVWDWFPVTKRNGIITSEWDKNELEELGFIKNDMLSITQLDEVKETLRLIKEKEGIDIDINKIPLDDKRTYDLFQEGFTRSVFQFSGDGMTRYITDMMPNKIGDLIAANALYRPGSMNSGMHHTYVKVKNGLEIPHYLWGLEEITKETYSTTCYQEQILKISQDVGGLTLAEADVLRRAISKKDIDSMRKYESAFISNAIKKGCPENEANKIWQIIEDNADYSFNKSHSACYAIIGYQGMYLKAHYPIHFYSSTLSFLSRSNKKEKGLMIAKTISEIKRIGDLKVVQVDINNSAIDFVAKDKTIYLSLISVKQVGKKAVEEIISERNKNGKFFSLQDFLERIAKRSVNKRVITNLIISGAFDETCGVKYESDRMGILKEHLGDELPDEFKDMSNIMKPSWWSLKSKELTGLGFIDYKSIVPNGFDSKLLVNPIKFYQEDSRGNDVVVCGIVISAIERNSKRGKFLTMEVDHNSEVINVLIWNESYEKKQKELKDSKGKIIFVSGVIKYDNFKQKNAMQSDNKTKIEVL
jgi:DNA polymerase III subunit alpha